MNQVSKTLLSIPSFSEQKYGKFGIGGNASPFGSITQFRRTNIDSKFLKSLVQARQRLRIKLG